MDAGHKCEAPACADRNRGGAPAWSSCACARGACRCSTPSFSDGAGACSATGDSTAARVPGGRAGKRRRPCRRCRRSYGSIERRSGYARVAERRERPGPDPAVPPGPARPPLAARPTVTSTEGARSAARRPRRRGARRAGRVAVAIATCVTSATGRGTGRTNVRHVDEIYSVVATSFWKTETEPSRRQMRRAHLVPGRRGPRWRCEWAGDRSMRRPIPLDPRTAVRASVSPRLLAVPTMVKTRRQSARSSAPPQGGGFAAVLARQTWPSKSPATPRRRNTSSWARRGWRSFLVCPRCATASCSSATRTRACGWTACRARSRAARTCRCFPSARASCSSAGWRFASPARRAARRRQAGHAPPRRLAPDVQAERPRRLGAHAGHRRRRRAHRDPRPVVGPRQLPRAAHRGRRVCLRALVRALLRFPPRAEGREGAREGREYWQPPVRLFHRPRAESARGFDVRPEGVLRAHPRFDRVAVARPRVRARAVSKDGVGFARHGVGVRVPGRLRPGCAVVRARDSDHHGRHHGRVRVHARVRGPRLGAVHVLVAGALSRRGEGSPRQLAAIVAVKLPGRRLPREPARRTVADPETRAWRT